MNSLKQVIKQLKAERACAEAGVKIAQAKVDKLDQAIASIRGLDGKAAAKRGRKAGKRAGRRKIKMSAAGRARIAAAQKKRWAAYKKAKAAK